MRLSSVILGVILAAAVAGCALDNREWMKADQPYTVEEFQRDYRECSKGGALDEDCMKRRGWVAVAPGKPGEQKADPLMQPTSRSPRRY